MLHAVAPTNSAGFIDVETVSGAVFVEEAQAACVLSCPEEGKCDFGKQPAREELCMLQAVGKQDALGSVAKKESKGWRRRSKPCWENLRGETHPCKVYGCSSQRGDKRSSHRRRNRGERLRAECWDRTSSFQRHRLDSRAVSQVPGAPPQGRSHETLVMVRAPQQGRWHETLGMANEHQSQEHVRGHHSHHVTKTGLNYSSTRCTRREHTDRSPTTAEQGMRVREHTC